MNLTRNWRDLQNPNLDLMSSLSVSLAAIEQQNAGIIPNLHKGHTLYIGSDYGGEHKRAAHQILSFLITDNTSIQTWNVLRQQSRQLTMPGYSRRIAYKRLNDGVVSGALEPFLRAADSLNGLSFTVAVDQRIKYLSPEGKENSIPPSWYRQDYERAMRVVHIVSLLVAGLSRPDQNVHWLTDEDNIVANAARCNELTQILGCV